MKHDKSATFKWVNCPNCGRKFYKSFNDYHVEIMCHSCKGVYLIWQDKDEHCHELVQAPRRYGPTEYK
jgi:Zn-finger nucleic acid-binding protein